MLVFRAESRSAISRAKFFLEKAKACPVQERGDFEAFLEAAIVFGRAAVHRMRKRYGRHPAWNAWWEGLRSDPAAAFFRAQRDFILKEASPKLGQKVFVPSIGSAQFTDYPTHASDLYYFEEPAVNAAAAVEGHLKELEVRLAEADERFSNSPA